MADASGDFFSVMSSSLKHIEKTEHSPNMARLDDLSRRSMSKRRQVFLSKSDGHCLKLLR